MSLSSIYIYLTDVSKKNDYPRFVSHNGFYYEKNTLIPSVSANTFFYRNLSKSVNDFSTSFYGQLPEWNDINNPIINLLSDTDAYPTINNNWQTEQYDFPYFECEPCAERVIGDPRSFRCSWPCYTNIEIANITNNIVTTVSAHPLSTFDVILSDLPGSPIRYDLRMFPLGTAPRGGGIEGGKQYFVKRISNTQFSLHEYNGSNDGTLGTINPETSTFRVHDSVALDIRVPISQFQNPLVYDTFNFPVNWAGRSNTPNSHFVKQLLLNEFDAITGIPPTNCLRLNWFDFQKKPQGIYSNSFRILADKQYTLSFYVRAPSVSAVNVNQTYGIYYFDGVDPYGSSFLSYSYRLPAVSGVWERRSFTVTPLPGTTSISVYFRFNRSALSAYSYDIANILFQEGLSATKFVPSTDNCIDGCITSALQKTFFPEISSPVGNGVTLIEESGRNNYHYLSRWGGEGISNNSLSCYVKPLCNNITEFTLGLLGSSNRYVSFNLNTGQINANVGCTNVFITPVNDWYRVGANILGSSSEWVGVIGYKTYQNGQYQGIRGDRKCYITGVQYELNNHPTSFQFKALNSITTSVNSLTSTNTVEGLLISNAEENIQLFSQKAGLYSFYDIDK